MKRLMAALAASGVLIAGAFTASLISSEGTANAQTDPETTTLQERPERGAVVADVLAGLVEDGTLTQDQADAVIAALEAKGEELEAEREAKRAEREADRALIRGFLSDGVLDADELAQLGADHPLNDPDGPAAEYLDDGQLTEEELRELRSQRRGHGHRGPFGGSGEDAGTEA